MGIVILAGKEPLHLGEGLELVLVDRVEMKGVVLDQGVDRTKLRDQHLEHIRIVKSPHGLDLGGFLPQYLEEPPPDEPWIFQGFGNMVSLFPAPLESLDPQRHLVPSRLPKKLQEILAGRARKCSGVQHHPPTVHPDPDPWFGLGEFGGPLIVAGALPLLEQVPPPVGKEPDVVKVAFQISHHELDGEEIPLILVAEPLRHLVLVLVPEPCLQAAP
jgi:hypothetical protein